MKTIILTTCLSVWFCAVTAAFAGDAPAPATTAPDQSQPADHTPQPPDENAAPVAPAVPATPAPVPAAVAPVPPPAPAPAPPIILPNGEKGLLLNFRGVSLETVLNYMSDAAGFIIHPKTDVRGKVDVWSAQPLSKDEALKLLKQILNDNGYTVMQEDRTLTIIRTGDAKTHAIPVISGNDPAGIPRNADVVTQIVPVHTLNVVQLLKNLDTLRPSEMTMTADESANSLVMTDTQENIHHMTEIVHALDSVTSGNATLRVFPLKFADAKALASLIKDLFPNPDTQRGSGGGSSGGFSRFFRGGGSPFGGGGGGDSSSESNGHTPTAKVTAVSDDRSNSLVVSAPDALIDTIAELVKEVDMPVEDTTTVQVFHLLHSDPGEMADLLSSLFPDDTTATSGSDASRSSPFGGFRFGGFGGFGGSQNSASKGESERMKKMAKVIAVPDRRTASLVVTASTNMMPDIAKLIAQLDNRRDRVMSPHIIPLANADPVDVQTILQELFPTTSSPGGGRGGNSASSSQSNPLLQRQTTLLQQQNSNPTSSIGGSLNSGSGRN